MGSRHSRDRSVRWAAAVLVALAIAGCAKKVSPVPRTLPAPGTTAGTSGGAETPPARPAETLSEPAVVPAEPMMRESGLDSRSLDDLNRDSPLEPVFFAYDSADISPDGQAVLARNADVMRKYANWMITVEGHCDERGTAEYNLALGERRALAASTYLVSLGIPSNRLRTVSYGNEFPFDPARTEDAYAKNRRAHFVITAK